MIEVHLLKERTGKQVIAKCGLEVDLKASDRLPEDFTVWSSRITCKDCCA